LKPEDIKGVIRGRKSMQWPNIEWYRGHTPTLVVFILYKQTIGFSVKNGIGIC